MYKTFVLVLIAAIGVGRFSVARARDAVANSQVTIIRTSDGIPVDSETASLSVGEHGPVLLQGTHFLEILTHFDRERIPERVVHAKGGGALGTFTASQKGISGLSKAAVFSPGATTDVVVRFSTVGGGAGSADTVRDFRGFAVKFKTTDGNWDLLTLSLPVFFINDSTLLPSLIHAQKKNPVSGLKDPNMFWDFVGQRPETLNCVVRLYSYMGIPNGYRHMDGFAINTFKLVNATNDASFGRFYMQSNQEGPISTEFLNVSEAARIAGIDPDYSNKDLYDAIANGKAPSWTLRLQKRKEPASAIPASAFDATMLWPANDTYIDDQEVGVFTLNKNHANFFADIEQVAFKPSNLVPGIEPAPMDKLLEGRLFVYRDTQVYRLGVNHAQLPINCPASSLKPVHNYERDGGQTFFPQGEPNYYPNTFMGPEPTTDVLLTPFQTSGTVDKYDYTHASQSVQITDFWESLADPQQTELVNNIVGDLGQATQNIQITNTNNLKEANAELGSLVEAGLMPPPKRPNVGV